MAASVTESKKRPQRRASVEFLIESGQLAHLKDAHSTQDALLQVPVTVCGLALGLTTLGHVWIALSNMLFVESAFFTALAQIIAGVTALVAAGLLSLYVAKIVVMGPSAFVDSLWTSVDDSSRLVTATMALISIAFTLAVFGLAWLGAMLWVVGVACHVGILCIFIPQVLQAGLEDIDDVSATWVVPTIGLSVASASGAVIGFGSWVAIFFWFGLASAFYFYPLALYRVYIKGPPILDGLVFTNIIFLAPPSLLLVELFSIGGDHWQPFPLTHLLFLWLLCALVLVSLSLPRILSVEFNTVASAMTFPADLAAKASLLFWFRFCSHDPSLSLPFLFLALLLFAVANFVVGYVTVRMAMIFVDWYQNEQNSRSGPPATVAGQPEAQGGYQTPA